VLDALLSGARTTRALDAIAREAQLPAGEALRAVELGRDAHTSHHVVAIRDREAPHTHAGNDLVVVLLRGHGHQLVAGEERPVGPGSILYIPRGTLHAFRNASTEPAVAYVVYLPPRA
jgi:mannose-6-phosphate isomerase-like protein (cupin superfamily)